MNVKNVIIIFVYLTHSYNSIKFVVTAANKFYCVIQLLKQVISGTGMLR